MINDIKMENQEEVLKFFLSSHEDGFSQLYSKEEINNMILNIIRYIELQINCSLIESIITVKTTQNKLILPFWPIQKILSLQRVQTPDNAKVEYLLTNNKLEIMADNNIKNPDYIVIYKVGYPISIVKQLPISIIMEQIILNYSAEGVFKSTDLLATLLATIGNIYGMGD